MPPPSFDLNHKVALITGASRGIGLAIAQTYAASGAKVVLSSRDQVALEQAAQGIRADGGRSLGSSPLQIHS